MRWSGKRRDPVRFGPLRLHLRSGEVRREGRVVVLQDPPLRLLTVPSNAILRRMSGEPIAEDVARRHGLTLIVQFGSTVSGKAHEMSDVDVAVLFDRSPPTPDHQSRLLQVLQALFPDREVHLTILDRADPLFLKQIFEHSRLLGGSACRFAEMT